MGVNTTDLIKGVPDWNQIINENNAILSNAIDANSNKIGDLTGLTYSNLADNVKKNTASLETITNYLYNVKLFGVNNDGTIDVTEALQILLDSLGSIYLPNGTYLVDGLVLNDYNSIVGQSKKAILKKKPNTTKDIITIETNKSLCAIEHITIQGDSKTDVNKYKGIYIKPRDTSQQGVYDTSHYFNDVQITNVSGDAIKIDTEIRGCRFCNIKIHEIGGNGINSIGTDNMFQNCSVGQIMKNGIILSQNCRVYSSKPFLCGQSNDGEIYYAMKIERNNCNVFGVDIQQNAVDGIRIEGANNLINIVSDGMGTGNTDNNGNISIINFGVNANSNKIIGSFGNGNLGGAFNYIVKFDEPSGQINNIVDVNYYEMNDCLIDVNYFNTSLHPSNKIIINGNKVNKENNMLSSLSYPYVVYTGHSTLDTQTPPVNGKYQYNFPLDIKNAALNGGCAFRFHIPNATINAGKLIYVSCKIKTNVPNSVETRKEMAMFAKWDGITTSVKYPLLKGVGFHNGYYQGVIDISSLTNLIEDNRIECTIALGLYKKQEITTTTPISTDIYIEDLYIEIV